MAIHLPAALKHLDAKQRAAKAVTLRKFEEDEIKKIQTDPDYNSSLDFLCEPVYHDLAKRIPPLQSLIQYKILEDRKLSFEKLIESSFSNQDKYNTSDNIYFGTIVSRSFNATVSYISEHNEYLVILSETFWEGLRHISDIIAAPLRFKKDDHGFDVDYVIAERHTSRFGEIMRRLVSFEHLYGIEIEPNSCKTPIWQGLWNEFHEAMESFAFGHEYGHFVKRHSFDRNEPISMRWWYEYDADRVALDLVAMSQRQSVKPIIGSLSILISLVGCYLLFLTLLLIEEFDFYIATSLDSHPPTIFRFANFKRICFENLGSIGLTELDKYICSIDGLVDFYIRKTSHLVLSASIDSKNLSKRIERSFQKSVFWRIMRKKHDDLITYLDRLYQKFEKATTHTTDASEQQISVIESSELRRFSLYISQILLSEDGAEQLLELALQRRVLSKADVLRIIKNCIEIYKVNKIALQLSL